MNEGSTKTDGKGNSLDGQYSYGNVKRWGKKVTGTDIFDLDKIFFPINISQSHWILVVVYMKSKKIQFYDSMKGEHRNYLNAIFQYLKDKHLARKGTRLQDEIKWQLIPTTNETPLQHNGVDCGVYVCTFANLISMDLPLVIRREQAELCRLRIALAILTKQTIVLGGKLKVKKK